jgi:hypothetical protein
VVDFMGIPLTLFAMCDASREVRLQLLNWVDVCV